MKPAVYFTNSSNNMEISISDVAKDFPQQQMLDYVCLFNVRENIPCFVDERVIIQTDCKKLLPSFLNIFFCVTNKF